MIEKRSEAFFALIAPIGIDLDIVNDELLEALKMVNYGTNLIKLTDLLRECRKVDDNYNDEITRYKSYIDAGDKLCDDSKKNDIFSLYGVARVAKFSSNDRSLDLPTDTVHIFRQIKRVDEIKTLERIYGRNILYIGCYASKKDRISFLINKMLKNQRGTNKSKLESQALDIISTDEDEREKPHGQKIVDCYPYSDFIIDCTSRATIKESCFRLISIYFGNPFISPNQDEYCSYIANAASYRSLDLSRQVGAAIFGRDCEVISMGCNEVPKAGGGTYWAGSGIDHRDYAIGYDSNQKVREDMARDTLTRLKDAGWLSEKYSGLSPEKLVNSVFSDIEHVKGPLHGSMLSDVIEYGRMVHAEMNALADASRFRKSTIGSTLYCTTMPCHMCTKMIIASGISRVVFLQPYGKSLVEELFHDSIEIDNVSDSEKIKFETLKGVTPNGFKRAFHKIQKRKNRDGSATRWDSSNAVPTFLSTFPYYVDLEKKAISSFKKCSDQLGLIARVD